MKEWDMYQKAKRAREQAEKWNALSQSERRYKDSTFEIDVVNSTLVLTRCGKHAAGLPNYHKSGHALNVAILDEIKADPTIIDRAIERLRRKEFEALIACRAMARDLIRQTDQVACNGHTAKEDKPMG